MSFNMFGSTKQVVVIGDLMLDKYIEGEVSRLSPEAPVPILNNILRRYVLGGALNVANNVHTLGMRVKVVGVVGQDLYSKIIQDLLEQSGIYTGVLRLADRPTTVKTRIIARSQQLCRVDDECLRPLSSKDTSALKDYIDLAIVGEPVGLIVLEDYGKGVVSDTIVSHTLSLARSRGIPVVVDPKGGDYKRYCGASLLTPNLQEAQSQVSCKGSFEEITKDLVVKTGVSILTTLGEQGMYYVSKDEPSKGYHLPTAAGKVVDVSGAGDTVVAGLALGVLNNHTIEESMAIANAAAAVVLGKLGTATVTREELMTKLHSVGGYSGHQ